MRDNKINSGDIMFGPIDGLIPGIFPVGVGQVVLFLTRRWWKHVGRVRQWFHVRHVGMIIDGGTNLIQAMPKGCEIVPVGTRAHEGRYVFIRPDYASIPTLSGRFFPGAAIALSAAKYVGTPYNFLTYLKLAAGVLRFRFTERWLIRHMSTRKDMMCSQHIDQSLADAGYHVFDDGRLPQDVLPAELFVALLSRPGLFRIPGHPLYDEWTVNSSFPVDGL